MARRWIDAGRRPPTSAAGPGKPSPRVRTSVARCGYRPMNCATALSWLTFLSDDEVSKIMRGRV